MQIHKNKGMKSRIPFAYTCTGIHTEWGVHQIKKKLKEIKNNFHLAILPNKREIEHIFL